MATLMLLTFALVMLGRFAPAGPHFGQTIADDDGGGDGGDEHDDGGT
jgi:hypothetical protein